MEELIRDALLEWKNREIPALIEREVSWKLSRNIFALIGPRRAGKTFFLYQIAKSLINEGYSKNNIAYVDFEDVRFSNLLPQHYPKFLKIIHELFEEKDGKLVLLLDEVQNLKDFGKWLRTLHNSNKYYIFVTGSSSKLLAKEIATELRGRYVSKVILPFSFKEFLKARSFNLTNLYSEKEGKVLRYLREYMRLGGFPQIVIERDVELVKNYLDTIFYRDIVERNKVRNVSVLENFMKILINNSSKFFSISKAYNYFKSLNVKISKKKLIEYLSYFTSAFFVMTSEIYSYSEREKLRNPRKIYLIDLSFYNLSSIKREEGSKMENLVAIELFRRGRKFYYFKVKDKEIDFVTNKKEIIEVCYNLDKEHISKVFSAMNKLNVKKAIIVTWDERDEIKNINRKIKVIPLYEYLLETNLYK